MTKDKVFDQVIVAGDFSPRFLNFWPIVSEAWQQKFDIVPHLALVYKESEEKLVELVRRKLLDFGNVHFLKANPTAPLGNQAKLARFYVAAQFGSEFVTVDDLDTIHPTDIDLRKKFLGVDREKFVAVGAEVYLGTPHEGGFPAGNFSGPGDLFNQLFNIGDKSFSDYIESFKGHQDIHLREDPFNEPKDFSDEYLIRALFSKSNLKEKIQHVARDTDIQAHWLDRSWWPDNEALKSHANDYIVINMPRPYWENREKINIALKTLEMNRSTSVPLPYSLAYWSLAKRFTPLQYRIGK